MSNDSTTPPNPSDQSRNPGAEHTKPMNESEQELKGAITDEPSTMPVLVNPEPLREDQVQNAVKFLSHPKVRGSPVIYRRSFLEKKGLTKDEIDEAFRRVPDPPSNVTSVEAATSNQAGQPKTSASLQTQVPTQASPVNAVSVVPKPQQPKFQWSYFFVAIGALAASGVGTAVFFKKVIVPRLKAWIREVVSEADEEEKKKYISKPIFVEEVAEAAKTATTAATVVAKASQDMLTSKSEERKSFDTMLNLLGAQLEEMKSMSNAIRKLEDTRKITLPQEKQVEPQIQYVSSNGPNNAWGFSYDNQPESRPSSVIPGHVVKMNGTVDGDFGAVRPSSEPASAPAEPPHPKGFTEVMAMLQRGEKPPGIKEINDQPPNPNQPPTNPHLAPRPKPWEIAAQYPQSSSSGLQSQARNESPIPTIQENVPILPPNGTGNSYTEPWWQRRSVKITEIEPETDQPKTVTMDRPVQRTWVPPKPPTVVMPEATEAIRRPKPIPKEQSEGDERSAQASGGGEVVITGSSEPNNGIASSSANQIDEEQTESVEVN
ncbi:Peroxisomal membrane protein PEX14 [Acorus calamus]|uniref:Peroxisomal membrane protein PEX14 n=1 Tax=Acorus calamus TaxID=4465 RepID=A0AAV9DCM3_ACOCL|nr:Peroxisomal membrane protein PEX14 [Acorus calamus]